MTVAPIRPSDKQGPPDGIRPALYIRKGELDRIAREAVDLLVESKAPIFMYGDTLRRLVAVDVPAKPSSQVSHGRGTTVLRAVTPGYLAFCLSELAGWFRWDARAGDYRPSDVPPRVAAMIVDAADQLSFPRLKARAGCPQILPNGDIARDGYHDDECLLVEAPGPWVPPVAEPTQSEAKEAVATLRSLLRFFPWTTPESESAAVAAIITAAIRPTLDAAPLFAINAPLSGAGTGKSLLARAVSIIATGHEPATMTWPATPGEGAKRLDAAHLAGDRIILVDNLSLPLDDDALCTALTSPVRTIRELGASKTSSVPMHALHIVTGNATDIRGDLVRRTLMVSLDPETDSPDQRDIPQDLLDECRQRRGSIVRAVHTILLAYIKAGEPDMKLRPMGDFRQFARRVRAPLMFAGLPDPAGTQDAMRADDPKRQTRQAMFSAWAAAFGHEGATAREAVELLESDPRAAMMPDAELEALRDAVEAVALRRGRIDARALGSWMRLARDARFGRFVLAGETSKAGRVRWVVDEG